MSIQFGVSSNPFNSRQSSYDAMDRDALLMEHQKLKDDIDKLKEKEMELRKYIVDRCFPNKQEGTNTLALGNGYELKAGVKFNYKLAENKIVETCLDKISAIGNQGAFVADRLVSWSPSFLLTEYRNLQEQAKEGDKSAIEILKICSEMLTIDEAAPTLAIKEPKGKKK
jgi:hypothetical protein